MKSYTINCETLPFPAYSALMQHDREMIGTNGYLGLAYFWNYDYRHALRPASPYLRRKVYTAMIRAGLEPDGNTEKHTAIIKRFFPDW